MANSKRNPDQYEYWTEDGLVGRLAELREEAAEIEAVLRKRRGEVSASAQKTGWSPDDDRQVA